MDNIRVSSVIWDEEECHLISMKSHDSLPRIGEVFLISR